MFISLKLLHIIKCSEFSSWTEKQMTWNEETEEFIYWNSGIMVINLRESDIIEFFTNLG